MSVSNDPLPGDIRASDGERERLAGLLRDHAAEGRLETDELERRLERVYAARTRGELEGVTHDLPAPQRPDPLAGRGRDLRGHVAAFVAVNLLLVTIWAASGAGYFWPIWPLLGWGIGLASHASETALGRAMPWSCRRRRGPVVVAGSGRTRSWR